MNRTFFFILFTTLCGLTCLNAQTSHFRFYDADPSGITVEITPQWQQKTADIQKTGTNETLFTALTEGQWLISEAIDLPNLENPKVEIISVAFDEVELADAQKADGFWQKTLDAFLTVAQIGVERKMPKGVLALKSVVLDPETSSLKRFTKVVARIVYAHSAQKYQMPTPKTLVNSSVLASGKWFKIPITTESIYKIDAAYLQSLGLSGEEANPAKVQVFANGGNALPAINNIPRPEDLRQVSTWLDGNALYFFAEGLTGWAFNRSANQWQHWLNEHTNENQVFIRVNSTNSNVVTPDENVPTLATVLSSIDGRILMEEDKVNLGTEEGGGGDWYGEQLPSSQTKVLYDAILPNINGNQYSVRLRSAVASQTVTTLVYEVNGAIVGTNLVAPVSPTAIIKQVAYDVTSSFNVSTTFTSKQTLTYKLNNHSTDAKSWIDWVEMVYPQSPVATDNYLRFATPGGRSGAFEWALTGFTAQPIVWDISNPNQIKSIPVVAGNGGYIVKVGVSSAEGTKELVAFVPTSAKIKTPAKGVTVANQNLHGIAEFPDFVIVTHSDFMAAANELATLRRNQGMVVTITEIDKIFNEFSGGKPDMRAARDYFKFLYDRDVEGKFKYALFLGDGTFDMRGLIKEGVVNKNFVPAYQTDESLYEIQSYTSDDYFALLDDNEGLWEWIGGDEYAGMERLDIGIGRFPVQTLTEANNIIEKIKKYENPTTYGAWRTNYTFVSDNDKSGGRDRGDRDLHLQNADVVAEYIKEIQPSFNINKIHTISYPSETRAEGVRIPEARADVFKALNEGTLVWNYSGHGGWDGLTDEKIFRIEDIDNEMDNFNNLPIFVTATCSFGHWDYVKQQSGGEMLVLTKQKGAVAAFTTIRIVVTNFDPFSLNPGLNRAINTYLVTKGADGLPRRLGDVIRLAKNTTAGAQNNNRKFNLLGDPTLRVGMPKGQLSFDKINGESLNAAPINIQALQSLTIEGTAQTETGQLLHNGVVEVLLLDKSRRISIPNSIYTDGYYDIQKDVIFRSRATVNNGKFATTFVVPKDISQDFELGRISGYAWSADNHSFGVNQNVLIGGLSANIIDNKAPQARLFLNDTTFVSGGITHGKPVFIAKLFDENGINTVGSGVGHEMLLTLDGNAVNAVEIGGNFVGDLNRYQSGTVRYQLPEQSVGKHQLSLKVWDVANNSTLQTLNYEVFNSQNLVVEKLFNYPNPMVQNTKFIFEHNQPAGTEAKVQLKIYTLAGRLVRHFTTDEALPQGYFNGSAIQIAWDGKDQDGDMIATGTYIYKLRVEIEDVEGNRQVTEKLEKLVLIR